MQTGTRLRSQPITLVQLLGEALGGGLAGVVCALIAGVVFARLFAGASDGWGDLIGALLGAAAGYALGVALGVYAVGRRMTGRGVIWLSLLGSVLGMLLVLLLAEPLHLNASTTLLQAAFVLVPPIAATLAFNCRL